MTVKNFLFKIKRILSAFLKSVLDWLFQKRIRSLLEYFPIGFDPLYDIVKDQYDSRKRVTIFDVGANVGQSSMRFRKFFKHLEIHAFEPIKQTYELLEQNCGSVDGIHSYNLALGSEKGNLEIKLQTESLNNTLVRKVQDSLASLPTQMVEISTVDEMASKLNIQKIDLLKIDTEGYDLEVLRGSKDCLQNDKIEYVYCEVGFNNEPSKVEFAEINNFLKPYKFRFVGLYETIRIGFNKLPVKFSNALFVKQDR